MTANLTGVWLQRMEHVSQYLLGVALIIFEERRHDIVALCVLRGRGIPAIVSDVTDTELLDWGRKWQTLRRGGSAWRLRVLGGPDDPEACAGGAHAGVSVACL
ncbi:elongation factor 1-gamma (EF-1-gamma) [Trypanosoma cruzi]|nr:elongation factor 1-gamma (EF-1-gamma) [Trypanosoma cruzi]